MKCSQCGKELSAEETAQYGTLCKECAQNEAETEVSDNQEEMTEIPEERDEPTEETTDSSSEKSSNKKWVWIAFAAAVLAAIVAVFAFSGNHKSQNVSGHLNPTSITYAGDDKVGLYKNDRVIELYHNDAEDVQNHTLIERMFSTSPVYVGYKNYVELANGETVYLPLSFTSAQDVTSKLCSIDAKGNETVLDEEADIIYCNSDNSVYYNREKDGKMEQFCYRDGKITPMAELLGEENVIAIKASDDDSLLQVVKVTEDQQNIGGYFYNGKLHMLEEGYTLFNISKSGNEVYVMKADEETRHITMFRVKDLETQELEELATKVTEGIIYDDGSLSIIADCNLEGEIINPAGTVYFYDAGQKKLFKGAENAVALAESVIRPNGWMNENGRDIGTSEMSRDFERDKPLVAGQVHYIDADGNLCAAALGEEMSPSKIICEAFYKPADYTFQEDIAFATLTHDYFYWIKGQELFRYQLGSLQDPEIITLNESIGDKMQDVTTQVGYMIAGSGNVIEESNQALILKNFENDESSTILENVGKLRLVGMDSEGKNLYFISEDESLYEKSIESRSNPKRIASSVQKASAATDALYYVVLVEENNENVTIGSSEESSEKQYRYDLMRMPYGGKPELVEENVSTIFTNYLPE